MRTITFVKLNVLEAQTMPNSWSRVEIVQIKNYYTKIKISMHQSLQQPGFGSMSPLLWNRLMKE